MWDVWAFWGSNRKKCSRSATGPAFTRLVLGGGRLQAWRPRSVEGYAAFDHAPERVDRQGCGPDRNLSGRDRLKIPHIDPYIHAVPAAFPTGMHMAKKLQRPLAGIGPGQHGVVAQNQSLASVVHFANVVDGGPSQTTDPVGVVISAHQMLSRRDSIKQVRLSLSETLSRRSTCYTNGPFN